MDNAGDAAAVDAETEGTGGNQEAGFGFGLLEVARHLALHPLRGGGHVHLYKARGSQVKPEKLPQVGHGVAVSQENNRLGGLLASGFKLVEETSNNGQALGLWEDGEEDMRASLGLEDNPGVWRQSQVGDDPLDGGNRGSRRKGHLWDSLKDPQLPLQLGVGLPKGVPPLEGAVGLVNNETTEKLDLPEGLELIDRSPGEVFRSCEEKGTGFDAVPG